MSTAGFPVLKNSCSIDGAMCALSLTGEAFGEYSITINSEFPTIKSIHTASSLSLQKAFAERICGCNTSVTLDKPMTAFTLALLQSQPLMRIIHSTCASLLFRRANETIVTHAASPGHYAAAVFFRVNFSSNSVLKAENWHWSAKVPYQQHLMSLEQAYLYLCLDKEDRSHEPDNAAPIY